jgi:hypothetical protein
MAKAKTKFKTCALAPANQPWKLIRDAVKDLKKQEATPGIVIDMGHWHMANEFTNTCHQCLAGCTLARRCKTDVEDSIHADDLPAKLQYKLRALDCFRTNKVESGLAYLGLGHPGLASHFYTREWVHVPEYDNLTPEPFHTAMLLLADQLQAAFKEQAKWAKMVA